MLIGASRECNQRTSTQQYVYKTTINIEYNKQV